MMSEHIDEFLNGYMVAALWSSVDDDGEPLDGEHTTEDLSPETVAEMRADCAAFLAREDTDAMLAAYAATSRGAQWATAELAGHDFWLTRNGHGAGFWDRGFGELGERLTDLAHRAGGVDLYVGDDGLIYG